MEQRLYGNQPTRPDVYDGTGGRLVVTVNVNDSELTYHTQGSFALLNQQTDPEELNWLEVERRSV